MQSMPSVRRLLAQSFQKPSEGAAGGGYAPLSSEAAGRIDSRHVQMSNPRSPSSASSTGFPISRAAQTTLIAYGDTDDHLRLCGLLAKAAVTATKSATLQAEAQACLD